MAAQIGEDLGRDEAVRDYRLAFQSRQASLIGRREVLTGKAKFGIFGDGKELPQIAMAKAFRKGDIRSGYYRDQTFAFASGLVTFKEFFAQLFANPDIQADPHSGGRQMDSHFASRNLDSEGNWRDLTQLIHSSADASPTASQMPRIVGLAHASVLYRQLPELEIVTGFSDNGNEVTFGTIGNASCAEGHFWETVNAVGILQAPAVLSIWDDGYGISVPNEFQLVKRSLSDMLAGFRRSDTERGFEIWTVPAWNYEELVAVYQLAAALAREQHVPSIIHVTEVTQPQGHSTSGSHERYKTQDRLQWEKAYDCLTKMRAYLLERGFATETELAAWEHEDRKMVMQAKSEAWQEYQHPIRQDQSQLLSLISRIAARSPRRDALLHLITELRKHTEPARRDLLRAAHQVLVIVRQESSEDIDALKAWDRAQRAWAAREYNSHLYSETARSPLRVPEVRPAYEPDAQQLSGYEILNRCFDGLLARDPRVVAFGEDVGKLGDVNQGFSGLQEKYGPLRVMDTGIREATIVGQAIGLALRGLRPIAEIQYLDYVLYGLQTLSDDLATLRYRTKNGQQAPVIIRTRGHRLEGIWHAGSPMGMMLHALRGIHILVPRNMVQAAGMYHTLLQGDDPAIVVEVLNGYRLKERLPANLRDITVPLGMPELLRAGSDLTLVTYGACCRIALEAARQLSDAGIEAEVIDVQTLLPFDLEHRIVESVKKTSRLLLLDEDVPGGATAYMLQQVLETQGAYRYLDSEPRTISAQAHRPAYGDDGDYFSKPQVEDVFRTVYSLMQEADPARFPAIF
ncbi:MAG: thiamine pyrophosphate-dependent enzyme [Bacteroidia bacterium]|nr:thiamine pyrophosphate-dependent enzyme [Bacteroidia bacterium]